MPQNALDRLRNRFTTVGAVHVEELRAYDAIWATWSPESDGTRYDILLYTMPGKAFGRAGGEQVVVVCGTPGVQRVAFLCPTAGCLAADYVAGHLNEVGKPFSTADIYRLTLMLAKLLGRVEHLPDKRFALREGDTPFTIPRDLDCSWLPCSED